MLCSHLSSGTSAASPYEAAVLKDSVYLAPAIIPPVTAFICHQELVQWAQYQGIWSLPVPAPNRVTGAGEPCMLPWSQTIQRTCSRYRSSPPLGYSLATKFSVARQCSCTVLGMRGRLKPRHNSSLAMSRTLRLSAFRRTASVL
jgi:hypothetical protein